MNLAPGDVQHKAKLIWNFDLDELKVVEGSENPNLLVAMNHYSCAIRQID